LSKFQGKHSNESESYDDIRKFVDEHKMNVLSLRNRTGKHEDKSGDKRTLSVLTHKIDQHLNAASLDFRCLFCRVENSPAWRDTGIARL
jgi:hypothetical protein